MSSLVVPTADLHHSAAGMLLPYKQCLLAVCNHRPVRKIVVEPSKECSMQRRTCCLRAFRLLWHLVRKQLGSAECRLWFGWPQFGLVATAMAAYFAYVALTQRAMDLLAKEYAQDESANSSIFLHLDRTDASISKIRSVPPREEGSAL